MLDTTTKNLIDEARNILVGKIPSPQAQVEQITIALIYKFMDDMDQESIGMGGKVSFFKDEFEKYAWNKIFDPRLGGFEMLALYADAITRMSQNPHLPQLFRNIFKNAFLPYRDPETLRLFLKTINEFHYDHSENLGNAFEYLLSILGSQGDAGQFRTPRHIIDFMVRVVKPEKHERVLDPACGTAGFLIAAYKQIMRSNTRETQGDLLSYAERKALPDNFMGYDISPDMVRLSLVNLYLHGFVQPQIYEYDTLSSEERWEDYADVILANPPFMSPKGGIRPHKHFSVQSNRSEVLFVDYMAEHLTPTGRAAIIVPEGIIFQSGTAYKQLRKYLVESGYLWAVVSLPAGVFNPYAGVKTSILFLDRGLAKKSGQILFVKVAADGFDLGAQRRPVEANDLPAAQKMLEDWQASLGAGATGGGEVSGQMGLAVEKTRLAEDGEYNLSAERYRENGELRFKKFEWVELGEIADLIRGITFSKKDQLENESHNSLRVATTKASQETGIVEKDLYYVPNSFLKDDEKILREGDILISTANSFNLLGRTTFVTGLNYRASFGAFMTLIRVKQRILPAYLLHCLRTKYAKKYFEANANTTTNISNLTFSTLNLFKIPVPPVEVQREIVAEVEGYQRVIDGARAVVENWRPNVEMELEEARRAAGVAAWEVVKLETIATLEYGFTASAEESGDARLIRITDITEDGMLNKDGAKYISLNDENRSYLLQAGDLLVARTGATYGKTLHFDGGEQAIFASYLIRIQFPKKEVLPKYFWCYSRSDNYWSQAKKLVTGGGQPQFNGNVLKQIAFPLPPLVLQREIVERIEAERAVVEANRKLMAIYEAKIRRAVERVWEI